MITIIVLDYTINDVFKYHIDDNFSSKHFDCTADELTTEEVEEIIDHMGHKVSDTSYMIKENDDYTITEWDSDTIENEW